MILLGLDTSTLQAGVALMRDGSVVAERRRIVTTHSESLLALVDEVLAEIGARPADLGAVACGAGPGSFTGLRIGLATAKGLCWALGRPLVLVSSLAALAARAPDGAVYAVLDAYQCEVYAGLYRVVAGVPSLSGEERALSPEALALVLEPGVPLVGSGALRYRDRFANPLVDEEPAPRPADVARLGKAKLDRGETAPLSASAPTYIRPSEAERMKTGR